MGIRLKHLEGRLIQSFEILAEHGFKKVLVKLPGESPKAMAALQQPLTRPPLEIHVATASRPRTDCADMTPDGDLQKEPDRFKADPFKADPSAMKEGVARFVKGKFGTSPQTASQMMQSVYGMDYRRVSSQGLSQRLKLVTDLLTSTQKAG